MGGVNGGVNIYVNLSATALPAPPSRRHCRLGQKVATGEPGGLSSAWVAPILAFTRYSFTSLLCTNQPSFPSPRPPALPTLVQYYCTMIGQYETPLPTSHVYAIHHTILVITISCKGQAVSLWAGFLPFEGFDAPTSIYISISICVFTCPVRVRIRIRAQANPIYI